MGLVKLGSYLEQSDLRNGNGLLGEESVVGLSTAKQIIATKANLSGVNLASYKILPSGHFAYVPDTSRRGGKISLGYNTETSAHLVSSISIVFRVKALDRLLPDYLFMYFNRPEFDRYSRFNSWGSARETFSWSDMCDIEIELPSLEVQQKYVDVYNAMLANQRSYECGLEDLKLTCDAYVERLRHELPYEKIGEYIVRKSQRNTDDLIKKVLGLSTTKEFREPQSRVNKKALSNYKIVLDKEFAYVPTTDTWKVFAFGLNKGNGTIVVSPIYEVFAVDDKKILPEYLAIWFKREEFDRYVRYHSWGSARENFVFEDLREVKIPIPEIEVQEAIVSIYNAYTTRRQINERLKEQIKDICPVLIKGSLEEAERGQSEYAG